MKSFDLDSVARRGGKVAKTFAGESFPMRRWRLIIWSMAVVLLAVGCFGVLLLPSLTAMGAAERHYAEAKTNLQAVDRRQEALENQVLAMRTHIDSVMLGARREYRLIMPGERLEILQVQHKDQASK